MGGWQVEDASGASYVVPLGPTISPGGYALLYHRQTDLTLNNETDTVTLRWPEGSLVDRYRYDSGPGYDVATCRPPDGTGTWDDRCQPTPGGANRAVARAEMLPIGRQRQPVGDERASAPQGPSAPRSTATRERRRRG